VREIAFLNGTFTPLSKARVSIDDRGFQFGDGVYEVVRGYNGHLLALDRHWWRLERSLRELRIEGVDLAALRDRLHEAVARAGFPDPLVYLQVTRGTAPRSHTWNPSQMVPTILMTVRRAHGPSERERAEGVTAITTPDIRWKRCDIKSVNLLANVLARQQAREAGAAEAIFVGDDQRVSEGSHSAILIVQDGVLIGPPPGPETLPSITRSLLGDCAAELGLPTADEWFTLDQLYAADEVLLANTSDEVLPIVKVDHRSIAGGEVGPVARRLAAAFEATTMAAAQALAANA